jgi:pimeloyl-ACP methyl ester carboxylesterase
LPIVKVNGIKVYYEIHGEGFPLVMIQGYSSNSRVWESELIQGLSKKYQVIIFDNRGTGRSEKPDIEYSIKMMADDVIGLINVIGLPKVHILGLSMGGLIAQELALNYPSKIKSLILCSTNCNPNKLIGTLPEFKSFINNASDGKLTGMSREFMLQMCYTSEYLQDNMNRLLNRMVSSPYPTPPVGYIRQAQALMKFDSCDRLSEIKAPCLVLAGEKDILSPPENSRILVNLIPNAKLTIFKNTGHVFLHEIPDDTINEIGTFIEDIG